jgi:hypothetical protein
LIPIRTVIFTEDDFVVPITKRGELFMKQRKKFSAFETSGGKYSTRKIPQWKIGHTELRQYLDFINQPWEDSTPE